MFSCAQAGHVIYDSVGGICCDVYTMIRTQGIITWATCLFDKSDLFTFLCIKTRYSRSTSAVATSLVVVERATANMCAGRGLFPVFCPLGDPDSRLPFSLDRRLMQKEARKEASTTR